MGDTLREKLPPIYEKLLSPELDVPAIVETRATCENCEMCDKGTMPAEVSAIYFRSDTKCCTFQPSLPNFLVGSILRDTSPDMAEGQRRIRERIAGRIGVTPYCLMPSNKYLLLYRAAKVTSFGRSKTLMCPYLTSDGRCSIWRHREGVCATFYCKYDGGQKGFAFWKAFRSYLGHVEASLAVWATRAIARDVKQPPLEETTLTLEELEDRPPSEETYARTWGTWLGREEEFYVACANKVRNLSRQEFVQLVDETPKGRDLLGELRARYAALTAAKLPDRLALNPKVRRLPVAGGIAITTPYNAYDSMLLEKDLVDVLEKLRHDEPLTETRRRLSDEEGIEFADELLLHLVNHLILVPPET